MQACFQAKDSIQLTHNTSSFSYLDLLRNSESWLFWNVCFCHQTYIYLYYLYVISNMCTSHLQFQYQNRISIFHSQARIVYKIIKLSYFEVFKFLCNKWAYLINKASINDMILAIYSTILLITSSYHSILYDLKQMNAFSSLRHLTIILLLQSILMIPSDCQIHWQ